MFARFRQFGRLQHKKREDAHIIEYTASNAGLSDDMLGASVRTLKRGQQALFPYSNIIRRPKHVTFNRAKY